MEYEPYEIEALLEAFHFSEKAAREKIDFIKQYCDGVELIEEEVRNLIPIVSGIILARLEQKEVCPECFFVNRTNCKTCFGTGMKNIYHDYK
jgi:hypothetical protein